MLTTRRQTLIKTYKLFDLLIMVFSFALATWMDFSFLQGDLEFKAFLAMRIKIVNFALFLGMLFLWQMIFSAFGLYRSRRLSGLGRESLDLLKATSLGTLAFYIMGRFLDISIITPLFLLGFWAVSSSTCILSRILLRKSLKWLRLRGRNIRFMLIVGTNERAVRFAKKIESQPELGYRILGFVENGWKGNGEFKLNGYRVVSNFEGFPSFIRENAVDEVVLCLPIKSLYDRISTISKQCEEQGIIVRHLSDLFELKLGHTEPSELEGEPLISHYTGPTEGWEIQVKRVLDIILSSLLLLVLSPVFVVVAFLIKVTSPGPVFFIQQRVGLNKRRFPLYKFRTMVPDAEKKMAELEALNEITGPVFKIKDDPRITPIGKLLRKTSMDELPQLYNVLKGDMSLVGPRALPVRDYEGFDQDWHRRRFSVRPGITCLWQVNGRSAIQFDRWMELDMEYIDEWSLWLDFKILAKTVPAVLRGSGAA